jgi:hypothetical protein
MKNTTPKQMEFPNWNQLFADANPNPSVVQSSEACFRMAAVRPVNEPIPKFVQLEFPFVERFND